MCARMDEETMCRRLKPPILACLVAPLTVVHNTSGAEPRFARF